MAKLRVVVPPIRVRFPLAAQRFLNIEGIEGYGEKMDCFIFETTQAPEPAGRQGEKAYRAKRARFFGGGGFPSIAQNNNEGLG